MTQWPDWRSAWTSALYGPGGFYLRPEGPAGHFRTASHAAPGDLGRGLARLCAELGCQAVVDVGAGRGELLSGLSGCLPASFSMHGVEVVPRPERLPERVGWFVGVEQVPPSAWRDALVIAWELLDVIPCSVLELDADRDVRQVLVEPFSGREKLGMPADLADLDWCARWWPRDDLTHGDRIESGIARDAFWSSLVARALAGQARAILAVDYGHRRETRPRLGSLTGFQGGRAVPPRPDGSMDVTAHVAMDAVAVAGRAAGALSAHLSRQGEELAALGVRSPELLDPGGLGAFDWLLQVLTHG